MASTLAARLGFRPRAGAGARFNLLAARAPPPSEPLSSLLDSESSSLSSSPSSSSSPSLSLSSWLPALRARRGLQR
jgi:hypothetical protein